MPNVSATPRQMGNGDVITQFFDSIGTAADTYTYPKTQEKLVIRNMGPASLSVTVAGVTQVIPKHDKWEKVVDFTSFSINAVTGISAFDAWADEKGSTFDTPEGQYFQNNGGGGTGGGGSGALVYSNLTALQNALPNGSTSPVWVTADNSWYYWSGALDTTPPTVSISPTPGTYAVTQSVTLTSNESATIYYTIDGSTPTESSSVYSSALSVATTKTIKYFAKDAVGNISTVQTATYTIDAAAPDTTAPTVNISPAAGTYTSIQSVTLTGSDNSGGAVTIYYTTDGSTPTQSSSVYSSAISVAATATIKYFGKDPSGNVSTVQTAAYTINIPDTTAPNPVSALTHGTPTSNSVSLSWTLSGSGDVATQEVSKSTDGTNFTVVSAVVSAATNTYDVTGLTASTAYTFRVVAVDGAGNRSTAVTTTATTAASTGGVVIVSDTFTKADQLGLGTAQTGQVWNAPTAGNSLDIGTNRAKHVSGASTTLAADWVDSGYSDNVEISCTFECPTAVTNTWGITFRCAADGTGGLTFGGVSSKTGIYGQTGTQITESLLGTHTFKVKLMGQTVEGYIDGVLKMTFTDTDSTRLTSTRHGLMIYNSAQITAKDFTIKTL